MAPVERMAEYQLELPFGSVTEAWQCLLLMPRVELALCTAERTSTGRISRTTVVVLQQYRRPAQPGACVATFAVLW